MFRKMNKNFDKRTHFNWTLAWLFFSSDRKNATTYKVPQTLQNALMDSAYAQMIKCALTTK